MLYADSKGKVYLPEEIEALPFWKIDEMGIHVCDEEPQALII
ncbi:MAG: hypothetical protein V1859_06780 [archaeon]